MIEGLQSYAAAGVSGVNCVTQCALRVDNEHNVSRKDRGEKRAAARFTL
jgi:hypothetical protein